MRKLLHIFLRCASARTIYRIKNNYFNKLLLNSCIYQKKVVTLHAFCGQREKKEDKIWKISLLLLSAGSLEPADEK